MQQARVCVVIDTITGLIVGVYESEKMAHFYARRNIVETGHVTRVSDEPVISGYVAGPTPVNPGKP